MRFRLLPREGSATFQKIVTGRKWVGRVVKCEDGRWLGKIGSRFEYAATAVAAFDLVVSRHLGFDSAADLDARNAEIRARNSALRSQARYVASEMQRGNFTPFADALAKL